MPATKRKSPARKKEAAYRLVIRRLFEMGYKPGVTEIAFSAADYREICRSPEVIKANGGEEIRNQPDVLYSFRSRKPMPDEVAASAPPGYEWIIELAGRSGGDSQYKFRMVPIAGNRVIPRSDLVSIPIPNATPEIILLYAVSDEQALLAKIRYNRLVDIFLGLTTYSLQSHLKTHVRGHGNIEIDEIYVGLDKKGSHYAIPVQAKVGRDQLNANQLKGDLAYCLKKFPHMEPRAISAQELSEGRIALLELTLTGDRIGVVDEKHYRLVPRSEL